MAHTKKKKLSRISFVDSNRMSDNPKRVHTRYMYMLGGKNFLTREKVPQ